jgi:hypothetical protein
MAGFQARRSRAAIFLEVLTATRAALGKSEKAQKVVNAISDYGMKLAPVADAAYPGAGVGVRIISWLTSKLGLGNKGLVGLRGELDAALNQLNRPVIILIDKLDRVENQEFQIMCQLVRSVMDFSSIS